MIAATPASAGTLKSDVAFPQAADGRQGRRDHSEIPQTVKQFILLPIRHAYPGQTLRYPLCLGVLLESHRPAQHEETGDILHLG